jgi:hypothetical protein
MIWDRSTSKWKKPTDESEKEELHEILDGREKVRSGVR